MGARWRPDRCRSRRGRPGRRPSMHRPASSSPCTARRVGEDVGPRRTTRITVTVGEPVPGSTTSPWGSECTVIRGRRAAAGNPDFGATTVDRRADQRRTGPDHRDEHLRGCLAEDHQGGRRLGGRRRRQPDPVRAVHLRRLLPYLDQTVYAAGYGPENPMRASFDSGETVTFTELPAGSDCTATESDTDGARRARRARQRASPFEPGTDSRAGPRPRTATGARRPTR